MQVLLTPLSSLLGKVRVATPRGCAFTHPVHLKPLTIEGEAVTKAPTSHGKMPSRRPLLPQNEINRRFNCVLAPPETKTVDRCGPQLIKLSDILGKFHLSNVVLENKVSPFISPRLPIISPHLRRVRIVFAWLLDLETTFLLDCQICFHCQFDPVINNLKDVFTGLDVGERDYLLFRRHIR